MLHLTWNQGSLFSRNNNVITDGSGFQARIYDRKIPLFTNLDASSGFKIDLSFPFQKMFLLGLTRCHLKASK